MSDLTDIHEAIQVIKEFKNNKIALMQCSSIYPCKPHDINLNVIDKFKSIFNFPIGFLTTQTIFYLQWRLSQKVQK